MPPGRTEYGLILTLIVIWANFGPRLVDRQWAIDFITKETAMTDHARRALILIDVQNEYFTGGLPIEYPDPTVSLANIVRAGEAAAAAGIPIVVVQQSAPPDYPVFARGSAGWPTGST